MIMIDDYEDDDDDDDDDVCSVYGGSWNTKNNNIRAVLLFLYE
jgi:hypothetical protein